MIKFTNNNRFYTDKGGFLCAFVYNSKHNLLIHTYHFDIPHPKSRIYHKKFPKNTRVGIINFFM
ncbi:hypothetical protein B0182_12775 [Moraxella bovis]|nr:hypothetical protein DQF64_06520 [Moraxella bovis]OOR87334.1 hypothetical protein B0182_12775 [Moraxella bovis]